MQLLAGHFAKLRALFGVRTKANVSDDVIVEPNYQDARRVDP